MKSWNDHHHHHQRPKLKPNKNLYNLKSFSFGTSRCLGTKNTSLISLLDKVVFGYVQIYRQEPCAVGPVEATPTGIEEKVIKSTFRFSLFASEARLGEDGPRFLETSEMDANMEPKTECSAKICSLCRRVENIKYISYSISNLIRFSINIYTASSKRSIGPWQCAGDETQAYLGHPQYHDPNL